MGTKDFSGIEFEKIKRYWNEDLKKQNITKIMSPTETIHISGIMAGKSPNDVKRAFESSGLNVVDIVGVEVRTKKPKTGATDAPAPKGPRMFCYLQFSTPDEGVLGLAQYGNSAGMRISFAKEDVAAQRQICVDKKMAL